ncbi:methylmalonyl Co-A mutase-associated GTPase MeaB [Roseateles paludis]|uniref:Methylmalonyl Co-A mutase-associated GTPase MeaB n=1 Tax=Roseateles paludis TaxID=3145238 RepID=A0ABV0G5G4_9BURK
MNLVGLAQGVLAGERRSLAKAITLVESSRPEHREQADALLTELLPHTGRSLRLGLSGVPGVGKSSFIEALGMRLLARGHKVAVLAIDPSSAVSGGAILGDKTRMERLSMDERAFIRPSPSGGTLGGVADHTREALLLCEAAGFDIVIVETVGVGQSETAVASMTDCYLLLQLPNAGDDLQAIKRGVMELAHLVVVNKADIDAAAATRAQAQLTSSLRLMGMSHHDSEAWQPQALRCSSLSGEGLDEVWQAVRDFEAQQRRSGHFEARRRQQAERWMWERIEQGLRQRFARHPAVQAALPLLSSDVLAGRVAASTAARRLIQLLDTPA